MVHPPAQQEAILLLLTIIFHESHELMQPFLTLHVCISHLQPHVAVGRGVCVMALQPSSQNQLCLPAPAPLGSAGEFFGLGGVADT